MNKKVWLYLLIVFVLGWGLEIVTGTLLQKFFSILAVVLMLMPALATLIVCRGLSTERSGIHWGLKLKSNWRSFLIAWFLPFILMLLGAVLYFGLIGGFDPQLGGLRKSLEAAYGSLPPRMTEPQAMRTILIGSALQALVLAPFLNILFALGEEIGWRGFLTPQLTARFGRRKALVLTGIIWGLWHAPLIVLVGYEYGFGYFLAPWSGVLLFCFFTFAAGVVLSWLYERTQSIWAPALFHGAINALANLPLMVTDGSLRGYLLGPAPNGLIAGLPFLALALWLLFKPKAERPIS